MCPTTLTDLMFPPSSLLLQMMVNRTTEVHTRSTDAPQTHFASRLLISRFFPITFYTYISLPQHSMMQMKIICFIVEFMLVCFNKRSHGWPSYCSLSTHLSCSASDHISFCLYASSLFYWVYRTFVSSSGQFLSFCHIWPLIPEQIPLNIIIEMYGVLIYF